MQQSYVTAMLESLASGSEVDVVLSRTKALVAKRGHQKIWPKILTGLLAAIQLQTEQAKPVVTIVAKDSVAPAAIEAALRARQLPTDYRLVYDDTIVGGMIIKHDHQVYDASYKRKLLELYQHITSPTTTKSA